MKNFLAMTDIDDAGLERVLKKSQTNKQRMQARQQPEMVFPQGGGATFGTIKASFRTYGSQMNAAVWSGGRFDYYGPDNLAGKKYYGFREPPRHLAAILDEWGSTDVLSVRCHEDAALHEMAERLQESRIALINALSVNEHPLQALADLAVLREFYGQEDFEKMVIAFIGPWNNVSRSLALACAKLRIDYRQSLPKHVFGDGDATWEKAQQIAAAHGSKMEFIPDAFDAATDANVVSADVFASMGPEKDKASELAAIFQHHRITPDVMSRTRHVSDDTRRGVFIHCMPIEDEADLAVYDGPDSLIIPQAGFRAFTLPALWEEMGILKPRQQQ
ncbi:MAG TPA: hypothetical protein PKV72_01885 [Candidatus Peribacteria bacterium]|nr:hypothetical protein [Candidatus Peribacteria bacterium]